MVDPSKLNPTELVLLDESITAFISAFKNSSCQQHIVTASNNSWVEYCTEFLPKTRELLKNCGIKVHYSQSKTAKFAKIVKNAAVESAVSFGDSLHERKAVLLLPIPIKKSIKFINNPTLNELIKQQTLIASHAEDLLKYPSSLDLMLISENPVFPLGGPIILDGVQLK